MLKRAAPLTLIVALAALARTWQLSQNEFGRQYYAAAVRSQLDSWHNFFYNSFDPAGFVSIDKPPVAIWLQVASAKLFGFGALSILLAQVMAGLAAIVLLYVLVQKVWGRTAGTVAALSLALSPVNIALVHNGVARFLASTPATDQAAVPDAPTGTEVRQPVLTDDSPTGPLRLFRPRAAAQFAWLLPLALLGVIFAWSDARRPGAPASRRISAGLWAGWLALYWIVLSFAGGLIHTYYVAVLGPPLAVFSGIAVAGLWSRSRAGKRIYFPLIVAVTAAWQAYLCIAQSTTLGSDWLSRTWLTSIAAATICGALLYALPRPNNGLAKLLGVASIGALFTAPILTAASLVLRRPNVAAPVANMTALLLPSGSERAAVRTSRLEAARQKLVGYLTVNRETANFLVAVPNANVAAPLIISTGQPVMALGGYLGDDPILTPADLDRLASDKKLRFVMLGGFTLAPAKQAAAMEPIARWVRANGHPVDPKLWRLSASPGTPYRINLGHEWIEVPPPELFDLWAKSSRP